MRPQEQRNKSKRKAWTDPEDDIVQDADEACPLSLKSTQRMQALALRLERTEKAIYERAVFLRLPPIERDRRMLAKREAVGLTRQTTIKTSKRKDNNKKNNPDKNNKNNKSRHDAGMTYKEQLACQTR